MLSNEERREMGPMVQSPFQMDGGRTRGSPFSFQHMSGVQFSVCLGSLSCENMAWGRGQGAGYGRSPPVQAKL